ncbi:hypothetical protein DVH24_035909 [Malus domestica]|uniref:Uncharacterized protein n=1 Tax=Malus domestica TaxID=3750 RepID=A0A498JVL0_MALDO|nr:hypothetical protein DVH24_035909 [Malus domestica]
MKKPRLMVCFIFYVTFFINGVWTFRITDGDKKNQGKWKNANRWNTILESLNGEPFLRPFVESLSKCPWSSQSVQSTRDIHVMVEDSKIFINSSLLKNSTVILCNIN